MRFLLVLSMFVEHNTINVWCVATCILIDWNSISFIQNDKHTSSAPWNERETERLEFQA